ncbi:hypothetical protein [Mycolicibacterium sp.]|nr:hypothetical protein [Mycolicibacterium sp.]
MGRDWDEMIASGEITPARSDVDLRDIEPVPGDFNVTEILNELREQ